MVLRSERIGENFSRVCANRFREVMNLLELVDLLLMEGRWTWTNNRRASSCSRINRFFISQPYLLQHAAVCQKVLQRPISDHFPICLILDGVQ